MSPVNRGISYGESLLYSLHRLLDAVAICLMTGVALRYTHGAQLTDLLAIAATSILVYHVVADLSGLYRSWRGTRLRGELGCLLVTWAYTVPLLLGIGLVTQYNAEVAYTTKSIWIFVTPMVMTIGRLVLRKIQQRLRARGFNTRSYAVCGVNELGVQLARNIAAAPEIGLAVRRLLRRSPRGSNCPITSRFGATNRQSRRACGPGTARHRGYRLHHLSDAS